MAVHAFDPDIAEKVGINAAVIYQNLMFWCEKNRANGRHIYDGKAWTYNSKEAFTKMFPYLSYKQVRTALDKLQDEGLIQTGRFNDNKYDQTLWYHVTSIGPEGPVDRPSRANEAACEGQPIPDKSTDRSTDNPPMVPPPDDLDLAVQFYNGMADRTGLPKVQKVTDTRKKKLRQRLRDCGGIEGWTYALTKVEASDYLTGKVKSWKADFDFLLQEKSFTKLMEGSYDNVKSRGAQNMEFWEKYVNEGEGA